MTRTKFIASVLVAALAIATGPIDSTAIARVAQNTGRIAGIATVDGKPYPRVRLRLRNVDNDTIVARTRADGEGNYEFTNLAPASYLVETVSDDDAVLAVSSVVSLTAAAMTAPNVGVNTTGAAVAAAGAVVAGVAGAAGAAGAAAAGGGVLGALSGSLGLLALAAGGISAAAIVAVKNDASPTQ